MSSPSNLQTEESTFVTPDRRPPMKTPTAPSRNSARRLMMDSEGTPHRPCEARLLDWSPKMGPKTPPPSPKKTQPATQIPRNGEEDEKFAKQ